jgi:hypothetical protein
MKLHNSQREQMLSLFDEQTSHKPDLAATFKKMREAGYVLEAPRKAPESDRPFMTKWLRKTTTPAGASCALAFYIPEDCA